MLQGRLILIATITLTACSGGAVREAVVEPGITAMDEARGLACDQDAATLRLAIEAYTALEGDPPADQQALVDAGYLRETSTAWSVTDGILTAEDPACDEAAPIATVDIVTETEPLDADELFASFDQNQIESVGGPACARELAEIIAAAETYFVERGTDPTDLSELVSTGYLSGPPQLWHLVDLELVPIDGSGCSDAG